VPHEPENWRQGENTPAWGVNAQLELPYKSGYYHDNSLMFESPEGINLHVRLIKNLGIELIVV
jgi:hypothetical protein